MQWYQNAKAAFGMVSPVYHGCWRVEKTDIAIAPAPFSMATAIKTADI